jgi:tellurite resistance protein TehA-like permease
VTHAFMGTSLLASIKSAIENLHPAYFAMIMATGIVSIVSDLLEMRVIGVALCWLNLIFFTILLVLTIARTDLAPDTVFPRFD